MIELLASLRGGSVKSLFLAAVFALGLACSREITEDVDGEQICTEFCALQETCTPGAPEYVTSCPGVPESCFETCMDNGGRGWKGECRFLRAEFLECLADLTCDESYAQNACAPSSSDAQPCSEERWAYDTCFQ